MKVLRCVKVASLTLVALRLLTDRFGSSAGSRGHDGGVSSARSEAVELDRITVVVVALNEEQSIRVTLERVIAVAPESAIIVCDDGSTDRTLDICHALALAHPTIVTVVVADRRGKMSGLRDAVKRVETPLVLTLDADTLVDAGAIEALAARLTADDLTACAGNMRPIAGSGFVARMQEAEFALLNADRQFLSGFACVSILPGAFTMWRTEQLRALVLDARNDIDLTFDALQRDWTTGYCESATCGTVAPSTYREVLRQRRRWARRKLLRVPRTIRTVLDHDAPARARLAQSHLLVVHVGIALTGWLVDLDAAMIFWRFIRGRACKRDALHLAIYFALLLVDPSGRSRARRQPVQVAERLLEGPWERVSRAAAAWSVLAWPRRNDIGWQPHRLPRSSRTS